MAGSRSIWTDPHIARSLLAAHLDPDTDAASRKPGTIARTVEWIVDRIRPGGGILDLGCGPGLYCERYAALGLETAGIDWNPLSVEHARRSAEERGLPIRYHLGDYLDPLPERELDAATCIYCDFGALSDDDERRFLENVRDALLPGGRLVLDAFGDGLAASMREGTTRERHPAGGFWSPHPHDIEIETSFRPEEERWTRTCVLAEDGMPPRTFALSDRSFGIEGMRDLLGACGFRLLEAAEDLLPPGDFTCSDVVFFLAEAI